MSQVRCPVLAKSETASEGSREQSRAVACFQEYGHKVVGPGWKRAVVKLYQAHRTKRKAGSANLVANTVDSKAQSIERDGEDPLQ